MDTQDLIPILNALPLAVQLFLLKLLAWTCFTALCALAAKAIVLKVMGPPQPTDAAWKTKVYRVIGWLDLLGLNTATLESLIELARKEKVIRSLQVQLPSVEQVQRIAAWDKTPSVPPTAVEPTDGAAS